MDNNTRVLLTTPHYPPQFGGLSTFALNIENSLKKMNVTYDLFHWSTVSEIKKYPLTKLDQYDYVLNIHFMFGYFKHKKNGRSVNFIHGSEILFTSPNFLKRIIKKIIKKSFINYFSNSYFNFFISNFTFSKLQENGLEPKMSRDIVFHNCIDTGTSQFLKKDFNEGPLKFVCVAKDVPHKNIPGTIKFCENVKEFLNREIELTIFCDTTFVSKKIKIIPLKDRSNDYKNKILRNAHFNLLLSLDHSKNGFFEGFGLVVLEASLFGTPSIVFNTGGLIECVHDLKTGWIIKDNSMQTVKKLFSSINSKNYDKISKEAYEHTITSHHLTLYEKLLIFLSKEN